MRKTLLRMTLRQLQVFRAVYESRSYSRAAEEMALTQPAVSHYVTGYRKPSPKTVKRIQAGVTKFAETMRNAVLV